MFKYLLQGLLFGFAYVAPIGAQNLYLINTAATKNRLVAYQVALITIFFDISLAIACYFGIGFLVDKFSLLEGMILLAGSVVITYIGIGLIRTSAEVFTDGNVDNSLLKTIGTCFVVTWLNPQAIIDGSLLLGGFRASLPENMAKYFIVGVCMASFLWFNSLATFVSKFRSRFSKVMRCINVGCGVILIFYGLKLGYSFILLIK